MSTQSKLSHQGHSHECYKCEGRFDNIPSHHQCEKCEKCGIGSQCKHFRCQCPYCGQYFSYNNRGLWNHQETCPQLSQNLPNLSSINNVMTHSPNNQSNVPSNDSIGNVGTTDCNIHNSNYDAIFLETTTPPSNGNDFSNTSVSLSPSPPPHNANATLHQSPSCYIQLKGAQLTPDRTRVVVDTSSMGKELPTIQLLLDRIKDDVVRDQATHWQCSFDPKFSGEAQVPINSSIYYPLRTKNFSTPLYIRFCVNNFTADKIYPLCVTSIHMDAGPQDTSTPYVDSLVPLDFKMYLVFLNGINPQYLSINDTNTNVKVYGSFPLAVRSDHQAALFHNTQPIEYIPIHPQDVTPRLVIFEAPRMPSPTTLQVRLSIQNFGLTDSYVTLHYYQNNDNTHSINVHNFDPSKRILDNNTSPNILPTSGHQFTQINPNSMHYHTAQNQFSSIATLHDNNLSSFKKMLNQQDELGHTPLHNAVINQNFDMARYLLETGASPNVTDEFGFTPFMVAFATCRQNLPELVKAWESYHCSQSFLKKIGNLVEKYLGIARKKNNSIRTMEKHNMSLSKLKNDDYISVALIAQPQVGKSSSLNSILKKINTHQAALVGEGTGIQGQNPTPYIFNLNGKKWVVWDFPGKYSNNIDEVLGFVDFCYSHDPVPNTDERHITDVVRENLRQLEWKQYPSIIVMVVDKNQILEDNDGECKDFYLKIKKRVKENAHHLGEIPMLCIMTHKNAVSNAENESEVNQKVKDFFQGILSTQMVFELENNEACRKDPVEEEEHQETMDKLFETMEVLHKICERHRFPPPSYLEIIKLHAKTLQKVEMKLTSVLIAFLSLLVLVLAINIAFS